MITKNIITLSAALLLSSYIFFNASKSGEGSFSYDKFETPKYCGTTCHGDFFRQWQQSMMSQAYTHHWDEIEYFNLAVPHAEKDPKVAEVKAGCNGCHAPLSYLAGDVPPPRPEMNSRANESVSCDVCHSITGFEGDTPYKISLTSFKRNHNRDLSPEPPRESLLRKSPKDSVAPPCKPQLPVWKIFASGGTSFSKERSVTFLGSRLGVITKVSQPAFERYLRNFSGR